MYEQDEGIADREEPVEGVRRGEPSQKPVHLLRQRGEKGGVRADSGRILGDGGQRERARGGLLQVPGGRGGRDYSGLPGGKDREHR